MVQPKKPPLSLRIPDETRAAVEQWATERGMPRNAAYVELLQRGLKVATGAGCPRSKPAKLKVQPVPPAPTTWPSGTALLPEHTQDPGAAPKPAYKPRRDTGAGWDFNPKPRRGEK